ncbi:hypothetical protein ACFY8B_35015 [Streptomyces sp. NPDC012751]|uniref:hypothetical protein n=1 Tax=Streptomyces sp. NPDC012751 TaxID=3364846 RepID=UPI0036981D66
MSGNQTGSGADPQPAASTRAGTARTAGRPSAPRPDAARTPAGPGRRQQAPVAPRPATPRGGPAAPSSDTRRTPGQPAGTGAASARAFTAHRAGAAWLLSPAGTADPRALSFAAGLAPDPEYTVLVADLPDDVDGSTLERMARAVPEGTGGLRLVFGRPPRPGAVAVARWLAERLGRTVLAADGTPQPTPGGGLFIGADRGAGWVRCAPGLPDARDSRAFPKPRPSWESALPEGPWSLGTTVAERLPAGVWLRPEAPDTALDDHRTYLTGQLTPSPELLTVVAGVPGTAPLPLADVARFWQGLPPHIRPAVRFVCYGPTRLSGGRHFGDVLAQVVGEPVRRYNGMPDGTGDGTEVLLVRADGSPGRPLLGQEFVHQPPAGPAGPPPTYAAAHRWPLGDLEQTGPGTYLLAPDVVVEVVPVGLWVRLPQDPPYAAEVRSGDPEPGRERVLCDAHSEEELPRLRQLAADLVEGFPPELRRAVRLGVSRPTGPRGHDVPAPAPDGGAAHPRPGGTGPARPHTAWDSGHEGSLSVAAEVLRRHPELTPDVPEPDAVAGLAAVLRRLADSDEPDGTGTEAAAGPAEHDGELLRTGLRMLPVHRGATGLRATLDEAVRQWYAGRSLVTDPDVCEASALGPGDGPGNTDVLIWSEDGRRTDLLDPLCPDRVLFLPGSRFRVLGPEPGTSGVVLMREVGPGQPAQDAELDRTAVRELTRAWHDWRGGVGA